MKLNTDNNNATKHKNITNNKHKTKLLSPPKLIMIEPITPPEDICNAPAIPVAVPELAPVVDTPPIIQFATVKPFPRPNIIIGIDIYKGCVKSFKFNTRIVKYDKREKQHPKIIKASIPNLDA